MLEETALVWNYSGDPSNSDKDAVRFLIGDTDKSDQQLQDAEIQWILSQTQSTYEAAITAVDQIIAGYSRQVSRTVGSLSIQAQTRAEQYRALRADLQDRMASLQPVADVFFGSEDSDEGRAFEMGMHDNPETGDQFEEVDG